MTAPCPFCSLPRDRILHERENACAPAGPKLSNGIPSAEVAATRPLKIVPNPMVLFMNTSRPNSQSASICPR